jgi:SAM-dependent methyltransferase
MAQTAPFLRYVHNLAESGYWFERALAAELRRFVAARRDADAVAVDFGCGLRPFAPYLSGFPGSTIGVDVYPGTKVDLVYDGARLPLADASADLVFSSSVFEHVRDLEGALGEIDRILKADGRLAAVVPFANHVHGTPFDYHRPTRFGWEDLLGRCFPGAAITVRPVDSRLTCLINMITAQLNLVLYDGLRILARRAGRQTGGASLAEGGASPESKRGAGPQAAYLVAKLNPVNFLLGLLAWATNGLGPRRRAEGEITSGYLIVVEKRADAR